ncbi:fimbrial-like adhesin protein [Escherichia coli]|uniref:Fimbrial-like adhesin protein n=1 Tax=Escherichia coli TaxID=562 RepID=A0A376TME3_ECOLX|nr:fimbrial-like adhesin protein [Escherichia coli]
MKKFFRHFLFLILCLSCYTASAGTDDNVGYIVGNSYGVGPSDQNGEKRGEWRCYCHIQICNKYK